MPYPTVAQSYQSERKPMNVNKVDIAVNGTPRARSFHTKETYTFNVVHEMVTSTEMQSILDCYASVLSSTLSMTWDANGEGYTCLFKAEPAPRPIPGGLWNITSVLIGQET